MKVILVLETTQDNACGQVTRNRMVIEGTASEVNTVIDELFDADRANDLRRQYGLKPTSASASAGRQ